MEPNDPHMYQLWPLGEYASGSALSGKFSCTRCRPNALIIHYVSNDQIVRDGEMVLIDAGCEYK